MRQLLASAALAALALAAPVSIAPHSPIGAAAVLAQADVTLENLNYKFAKASLTIPRVVVEGSTLTRAELEALFDGSNNATLGARIARLSAKSVTIPTIEITQDTPEGRATTIYRNNVFRDIRNGVVAESATQEVSSKVQPPAGAKDKFEIDGVMTSMVVKDFDMSQTMRFLFDKAEAGETPRKILTEQRIGQTRYRIGDIAKFTIGEVYGGEMKVRPLQTPVVQLLGDLEEKTRGGQTTDPRVGMKFAADFLTAMSFGESWVKGLSGEVTVPGSQPYRFSLDQLTFAADDKGGRYQIKGLKTGNGTDRFDLGEFAIEGVEIGAMLKALQAAVDKDVDPTSTDPAAMIPKVSAVRLSGIDIDVPDVKNKGQRVRAKLGQFVVQMGNHVGTIPADVSVGIDRLQMDIPQNTKESGLRDILAMGYSALDLSARYDQAWNEAAKTMTIRELSFRGAGMTSVKATAEIANIPRELFTLDKAVASVAALGATARSLQLHVVNEGLFEKLIAKQARDTRRKAEDIRAELAAGATMMVPMLLGDHPAARPIGAALGRFVADPKNLRVDVKAKGDGLGPTDFLAVSNPMELLKKVDITAVANQ